MEITTPIKLGFWKSASQGKKVFIVVSSATVAILGFLGIRHLVIKSNIRKAEAKSKEAITNIAQTVAEAVDKVTENEKPIEKPPEPELIPLPNSGVGCSDVKLNVDTNYDYVECNGEWFVISKQNPTDDSTIGKYKEWFSIKANEVATERLNRRYHPEKFKDK